MLVLDGGRAYRGDQGGYNLAVSNHAVLFGSSYSSPTFSICETDVISRRTVSGAATSTCCRRSARGPARRTGSTRRGRVSPDADKPANEPLPDGPPAVLPDRRLVSISVHRPDRRNKHTAGVQQHPRPAGLDSVSALPYNHRSSDFTSAQTAAK